MRGEVQNDRPDLVGRFRRGYLGCLAAVGWVPAALFAAARGPRAGLACLLASVLVGGDFLWITYSFAPLFAPGSVLPKGAAGRALVGMTLRMALLLLGLYATLRFLPGQGGAVAAGLAAPLLAVVAAGLWAARG